MRKLTQNEWIGIIVAIAVIALFVSGFSSYLFPENTSNPAIDTSAEATVPTDSTVMASGTNQTAPAAVTAPAAANSNASLPTPPAGQILEHDLVVGTGTEAVAGKTLTVDYVGTLQDGTKFDASADHGQPFSFTLGAGDVIKGWDQGVVGMKVGGIRLLIIPPDLGYGAQANGKIPANSVLVFEIRLDAVN